MVQGALFEMQGPFERVQDLGAPGMAGEAIDRITRQSQSVKYGVLSDSGGPLEPVPLALFLILQLLRMWVIATLGPRWTTRIIVVPGEPLVARGPYRYLSHPNYWIVAGEILVLPLAFGLLWYAVILSLLNLVLLQVRVSAENRALRQ